VVEGDRRLDALGSMLAAVRMLPNNANATTHSGPLYERDRPVLNRPDRCGHRPHAPIVGGACRFG